MTAADYQIILDALNTAIETHQLKHEFKQAYKVALVRNQVWEEYEKEITQ